MAGTGQVPAMKDRMDFSRSPRVIRAGAFLAVAVASAILFPANVVAGSWEVGYSFPAPTGNTNGLTYDGRYLWHTNDEDPIIYKINPFGGTVVGTLEDRLQDQGDLEFGGKFLWIVSENDHNIHKVDPATGKTLDTIHVEGIPPGNQRRNGQNDIQLEGITFDGRELWVDGGTNRIIRIDPVTREQRMYEMSFDMGYLDGMTWAFDHLWIVTNNATIYEIDPCSMGILDKFDAPAAGGHGPEGFAFDGENLWFADNGIDMIYKIILKFRIMTKRSAAPKTSAASATTAAQGCNQGILLNIPVPLRPGSESGSVGEGAAGTARKAFSTPTFAWPGFRGRNLNGTSALRFDVRGRVSRGRATAASAPSDSPAQPASAAHAIPERP
jgi:streptogramin lyase